MLIDFSVWLNKRLLRLLVNKGKPCDPQCFRDPVVTEDDFLFSGASDDFDIERLLDVRCLSNPVLVELSVVDQCDEAFSLKCGEKFCLEQLGSKYFVALK